MPEFVPEEAIDEVPDDNLLILVTGSQGEARSALSRIASDTHRNVALGKGDTVVFSSRVIPGNERAIGTVQDNLIRRGVKLMTADDHMVHVSGHPARDELRRMYALVRPSYAVPVHGEWRHLSAHAALAKEAGATPIMMEDGDILSFAGNRPEVTDSAPVGRLALDGNRLVPLSGGVMAARRRMLFNGVVVASVAVDAAGAVRGKPVISAPGLFEAEDSESARVARDFASALADLPQALAPGRRRPAGRGACCAAPGARPRPAEAAAGGRPPAAGLMGWFTAVVLYTLIWWTVLFAVLPFGTRPVTDARDGQRRLAWCPGSAAAAAEASRDDAGRRSRVGREHCADRKPAR